MNYESYTKVTSASRPGIVFTIRRMSVDRRADLTRRLLGQIQKIEFLEAGNDPREKLEAALLAAGVDREYLVWGLAEVSGLDVDGQQPTPEALAAAGPEDLCQEIVAAIKAECGLAEAERKN